MFCENCKKEIKEKKEKKIEIEGTDNAGLTLFLLAGAGLTGYLLWKKAQPTTALKRTSSPLMESNQNLPIIEPTTEKEKENMIRVD